LTSKRTDDKDRKERRVRNVKTTSTAPPEGLVTRDAQTIAETMARKDVSPKGIGSAIRMIQYFLNRAGRNLPVGRKRELEKAKDLLHIREMNSH
jgi:tRNA(adenine34) deaminase